MISLAVSALLLIGATEVQPSTKTLACTNIVHIGDSLTAHSRTFQKKEYEKLGYKNAVISAHGSRSVFAKVENDEHTGIQAVKYWKSRVKKNSCWVIALGTNDAAFYKHEKIDNRIRAVMNELKNEKVAWVNVWKGSGNRNNKSAKAWNAALVRQSKKYSQMSIIEWNKFISKNQSLLNPDKVHYGQTGSKIRAEFIRKSLTKIWSKDMLQSENITSLGSPTAEAVGLEPIQ